MVGHDDPDLHARRETAACRSRRSYEVTVDATATAVSGRTLGKPYIFSFTTPTVKLLRTESYRRGGRADAPFVVLLRFNQPVQPAERRARI